MKSLGIGVDGTAFLMNAEQLSAGLIGEQFATGITGAFVWATVVPTRPGLANLNHSATVYLQSQRQISAQQVVQGAAVFAMQDKAGRLSPLEDDGMEAIGWSVVQALVAGIEFDMNHVDPTPRRELLRTAS